MLRPDQGHWVKIDRMILMDEWPAPRLGMRWVLLQSLPIVEA